MIKKILLLFLIFLLVNSSHAQLSTGSIPPSFEVPAILKNTFKEVQAINLSTINLQTVHQEDSIEDNIKDIPRRFGVAREVDFSLENSGTWEILPNGDRIWRLKIKSPNALSLNINYDKFYLPIGAEFYLYSNKKSLIGAFTSLNNKQDSAFATIPTKGDEVTLEYFEPSNVLDQGMIQLQHVVHGYRGIWDKSKAFGSSGACNININCEEGEKWQDVKRAVAMVMADHNTRNCSGTLVNNVRQDSIPYFLTASHCPFNSNSIFVFNYENPFCQPNMDGKLTHSITGCISRAFNILSDFHLLELSVTPPDSFQVFYAGWSALNFPSPFSTAIHHPVGDVKKISMDFDSVISSSYDDVLPNINTHWKVDDWDIGTTQPSSSGSGLFDPYQRIVGQLQGGYANCGNNGSDWYGKFSYSWQNDPDSNQQLKYWLNPDNAPIFTLNGMDTDPADFYLDAEVFLLSGLPNFSCDTNYNPLVSIRNYGNDTLTSLNIHYRINSGPISTINWSGNLLRFQIEEVSLGNIAFPDGFNEFTVYTSTPNALVDQNTTNDTLIYFTQTTSHPSYIRMELKTDDDGEETTWQIKDPVSNNIFYKGGPYPSISGGQNYIDTLCLYDTCFEYTIFDSFGDGISGQRGNGYYLITDMKGDTLVFSNTFTSHSQSHIFCLDSLTSIDDYPYQNHEIHIYPNPTINGTFGIDTDMILKNIKLFSVEGKLVQEWSNIINFADLKLNHIPNGIYILSLEEKNGNSYSKKLLVGK